MKFLKSHTWLVPLLSFTLTLLLYRFIHTQTVAFSFIVWNLFLAGLPLLFSFMIPKIEDKSLQWGMFGLWLLFFPNSMYIVTDLFHLKESKHVPQWYDLLILCSAAINGVIMGMASLRRIELFLKKNMPAKFLPAILFSIFLLCGYGIYLGRYERWNSWDIFTNPYHLAWNIAKNFRHPIIYNQSWMISILFAAWLYTLYVYTKKIVVRKS